VTFKSLRGGYNSYYLYTPERVAEIEAEQEEHEVAYRQKEVRKYLSDRIRIAAIYQVDLTPDQLCRINSILNE
jgi:hypothetical protein